jgi:hypothetical protein
MEPSDLDAFAAMKTEGYVEIVFDDGTIQVGRNFQRLSLDTDGLLNIWEIKPDEMVASFVGGYNIKEIRWM